MKSKKLTVKQKNKRTIDILAACISILLALIVAASVVLGVGFGKYGSNTDNWFKPGTSKSDEVLPTPIAIGDKIALSADGEGLPLYINTSEATVAALDAKVADIMENGGSFETYFLLLGLFSTYDVPEDTTAENWDVPDGEDVLAIVLMVSREGNYALVATSMSGKGGDDGAFLYAHIADVDDGKETPAEGFQNDTIDANGRVLLSGEFLKANDYYVCDKTLMAGGWFQMADDDFVNMIFSTTPFAKA